MVASFPSLERRFIRAGRGLARTSRSLGTLYWFAEDDLVRRLRRSGNRFRRLSIAGQEMAVDVTDGTARLHYFHGEPYEPELAAALAQTLRAGDVFLDVGANIGFLSVLAAKIVGPSGRVIAFEPHPGALEVLRAMRAANGLDETIEIVAAAVGSGTRQTIALHLSVDSVLSSTDPSRAPLRADYPFTSTIDVAHVTIDGWTASREDLVPRIRAIKIDVEGSEAAVCEGMAGTIERAPAAAIFCETAPGSPADDWLRARGYRAEPLDSRTGAFGNYRYARRTRTMC
jgi:FkbM family methyltransferase